MRPDKVLNVSADPNYASPGVESVLKPAGRSWGEISHYRALFEQLDECIFIISFDLHYLAANPQALALLGYEESELIGTPVSDVVFLDDATDPEATNEDATLLERLLRCKNGAVVPVEISTSLVYDENGRPAYIQSIARNISLRKQAEQTLRRHNQILISISEATARLLESTQIENKITDVLELLGRAVGAVSCSILEINPQSGPWALRVQAEWQQAGSASPPLVKEIAPYAKAILRQTSGVFAVNIGFSPALSLAVVPIAGKQDARLFLALFYPEAVDAWLAAQQDALKIAANIIGTALQRYQREEAILLSEARHSSIIAALPDLIIRLDADGRILDYSARPEHPLYRPAHLAAGSLLAEIWPLEIVNEIVGANENGAFTQPHHLKEFKLPFSTQTYESRLAPIASREALLVIRDVTEQARLDEMKSDFINRASHELRTPLTTVIMMANLIQDGGTPEEISEYWGVMTSELNRQKILIERLLMAGRLESGTMKLELGGIDLIASLEESILAVKPIANKKNIAIKFDIPFRPLIVRGDNSALQQVFINLINNAAKFSPPGTSVEVNIALTEEEARVSIRDHGMGIPPEDIPHLYERFFRGRNVTIAEIPGSGIGLYIVKSILEELGGDINVESTLKEGTTLIVTLKRM
jgi:PAS domain S-box-containing protein